MPDEVFRSEEEVRHHLPDFPQLVGNAQRLLDACEHRVRWQRQDAEGLHGASAAADREKLHRDTLRGPALPVSEDL
jgi:hypothetical protein